MSWSQLVFVFCTSKASWALCNDKVGYFYRQCVASRLINRNDVARINNEKGQIYPTNLDRPGKTGGYLY